MPGLETSIHNKDRTSMDRELAGKASVATGGAGARELNSI
jgi:hypothetical protein